MNRHLTFLIALAGLLLSLPAAGQSVNTEEELWIANGERTIYGVLSKPSCTGHGFTPEEQARNLREIKSFLESR